MLLIICRTSERLIGARGVGHKICGYDDVRRETVRETIGIRDSGNIAVRVGQSRAVGQHNGVRVADVVSFPGRSGATTVLPFVSGGLAEGGQ